MIDIHMIDFLSTEKYPKQSQSDTLALISKKTSESTSQRAREVLTSGRGVPNKSRILKIVENSPLVRIEKFFRQSSFSNMDV